MNTPEKPFVIGITGNIGTGKSLVRKMLERLGGLGIDADALAHRALLKGSPVYEKVIAQFGSQLLNEKGEIERQKLVLLVFTNKEKRNKTLAFILSSTKPKTTRLTYMHQQLMLSKINNYVIARYKA